MQNIVQHWKWSLAISKPYQIELLLFFVLELIGIVLSLLFILWSKEAIDFAVHGTSDQMKRTIVLAIVSILVGLLLHQYAEWLNERTRINMLIDLQNGLIKQQMLSTWQFIKNWHTGDIQVRIHSDCNEIVQMLGYSIPSFFLITIRLFASFGFLWLMDPMLALLILAISPLFIFTKIYFRKFRKLNQELKKAESNFGHVVQENLRFRSSIRALNLQSLRWKKLENSQSMLVSLKTKVLNFSTLSQSIMRFTMNAGFLITLTWGIYRLHTGEISFGTMSAFLQLVSRIQSPIILLMGFVPAFVRYRTSADRLQEIMEIDIEPEVDAEIIPQPIRIDLEQVRFRYDDKFVLDKLNISFEAGKPTAIIGSSGKGKTTLIRLLLALLKPDEGDIWIHTATHKIALSNAHRENFAYVPQGDKLFTGTIRENLQIGKIHFTEDQLHEALYTACAEFVYSLPDGLDTEIGESGYGLSEGQAQRIAVARALLRNSSIWLFDEVTSALDPDTSTQMIARLMEAGKDKLLVFVTHDLKLANQCKKTIYIS
ncbi:ABC transporter ATP-binding protein/permease [Sphingobacterium sp. SRCM116780]|uniref:ABC transporter ATP-binding protein n=1 Tax=Sphingobacterium sp. SRCM116780 TaxID=2907623 RepID=UPI001F2A2044|nr:ABC transporter ATP-binding protein [Sphingobacterium sp. SRCM116780]UIR55994.1 ABC transporter ATP-binding protein/permease [Sphingobacterium sp. SRCM116780]